MAIKFVVADPRPDLLRRYDDEKRMQGLASTQRVQRSHHDRAEAFRLSLEIVDCFFRSCAPTPTGEPVAVEHRHLDAIRAELEEGLVRD